MSEGERGREKCVCMSPWRDTSVCGGGGGARETSGSPSPLPAPLWLQGSKAEELLQPTVNRDAICGLRGCLTSPGSCSSQDANAEPPQPAEPPTATRYEVVCDLSTPQHGTVISVQLGQWGLAQLGPWGLHPAGVVQGREQSSSLG